MRQKFWDEVETEPMSLLWAPAAEREDHKLVMKALRSDGRALRYASPELQSDRGVVRAALN